ncbi:hypothetical protein Tco_1459224 [Tanacetum coccineum]
MLPGFGAFCVEIFILMRCGGEKSGEIGRPGHFAKDCRAPFKRETPVSTVRRGHNRKALFYECEGLAHSSVQCPKFCTVHLVIADFSFISTEFGPLLNVKPSIVNPGYVIEVADGKKVEVDRIIRDYKLELGNSLFSINLITVGYGSCDVIVGNGLVVPESRLFTTQEEAFQTLKNNLCDAADYCILPDGVEISVVYVMLESGIWCLLMQRKSGRKMTEYEVGENVLLKVSPWKGVMHFWKKGLPKELIGVHDTFHVSNLKKCLGNANLHVPLNEIKIDKTLRFVEELVEIMDREVKSLKPVVEFLLVKVRWNSKAFIRGLKFSWETRDYMRSKLSLLFCLSCFEPTS